METGRPSRESGGPSCVRIVQKHAGYFRPFPGSVLNSC
jgi:hypothetical protein